IAYAWRARLLLKQNEPEQTKADVAQVEALLTPDGGWPAQRVAAGYAALGMAAEALLWLRRALERDKDPEIIAETLTHEDFAPVRDLPEFKALLAEFGGAAPEV
ncbi:MAG: hypothetical protein NZM11_11925, partial [Anaerolineales bacterium]|nr:hypothetical protein [Anaerolineales bacterium]